MPTGIFDVQMNRPPWGRDRRDATGAGNSRGQAARASQDGSL